MSNPPTGKPTKELARLTREQYDALEQQVAVPPFLTSSMTDLQAGQIIGVQHVLKKLRDGFVIEG